VRLPLRGLFALAVAAVTAAGCTSTPPPEDQIGRIAEATVILQLDDATKREVVNAYRAWAGDVPASEAEKVLDAVVAYGLEPGEIIEAFALALESMAGSATADGILAILDRAVLSGDLDAPGSLDMLRAIKQCATAGVPERVMAKGVHALRVWRFRAPDMVAYLRALPAAKSARNRSALGDAVLIYKFMVQLRLPPKYRDQIYQHGVQALARGMHVDDYGKFFRFLVSGRVPHREVVEYCGYLARHANEKVELVTIAPGYDAVEDLPLAADRRLALFEGVVAAAAGGADPADVAAGITALRRRRATLDKSNMEAVVQLILRTYAAYDSAQVLEAIERALASDAKTAEALAEALSLELSRVAAARRAG
jgi:hypothetical protein